MGLLYFAMTIFLFSSFVYLASALFLRTYNNDLSARTQQINAEIASLEQQNYAARTEISELSSSDRVGEVATTNGLSRNLDNVVTISGSTEEDGE